MSTITWEDLQPVLAVHQGAEALRRAVDGAATPPHSSRWWRATSSSTPRSAPASRTSAGEIAARQGLFQDKDEPVRILADRAGRGCVGLLLRGRRRVRRPRDALARHPSHAGQATLKGMGTFYGYTPVQLNDVLHVNPATEDAIDLVWEGYGVGANLEEARLFRAMGFHTGSEILADQEFVVLDKALRANAPTSCPRWRR
jgi:hypothetical protein